MINIMSEQEISNDHDQIDPRKNQIQDELTETRGSSLIGTPNT